MIKSTHISTLAFLFKKFIIEKVLSIFKKNTWYQIFNYARGLKILLFISVIFKLTNYILLGCNWYTLKWC